MRPRSSLYSSFILGLFFYFLTGKTIAVDTPFGDVASQVSMKVGEGKRVVLNLDEVFLADNSVEIEVTNADLNLVGTVNLNVLKTISSELSHTSHAGIGVLTPYILAALTTLTQLTHQSVPLLNDQLAVSNLQSHSNGALQLSLQGTNYLGSNVSTTMTVTLSAGGIIQVAISVGSWFPITFQLDMTFQQPLEIQPNQLNTFSTHVPVVPLVVALPVVFSRQRSFSH